MSRTQRCASAAFAVAALLSIAPAIAAGSGSSRTAAADAARVRASKALAQANDAYRRQMYAEAAALFEAAIQDDPALRQAYFFLANSYDNLAGPVRKSDAAKIAVLTRAAHYYRIAADTLSASDVQEDKKLARLAFEYLVAIYGRDKLNDSEEARAAAERMIALDPWNAGSYAALAKSYETDGDYEAAERTLLLAKQASPSDPFAYMQLAGFYNRQGQFDKTMATLDERASSEPANPEAYYTIATYYFDKAFRDFKLSIASKHEMVAKGLESIERALQLKPDYIEALVYKSLLLRLEANLVLDPRRRDELIRDADEQRERAQRLRENNRGTPRQRLP
jgi:tetratricopeptide (TPR) repeat protein